MKISVFDDEAFTIDSESYFYLWCCDCKLRHLVVVEAIGEKSEDFTKSGGQIAIAMARDDHATNMERKEQGIVLYRKKKRKK